MFCLATSALDIICYDSYWSRFLPILFTVTDVNSYLRPLFLFGSSGEWTSALQLHMSTIQSSAARAYCATCQNAKPALYRQGVNSSLQTPPNSLPAVLLLGRWPPPPVPEGLGFSSRLASRLKARPTLFSPIALPEPYENAYRPAGLHTVCAWGNAIEHRHPPWPKTRAMTRHSSRHFHPASIFMTPDE